MAKMAGLLADLASDALLKSARVADISRFSPRFLTVDLEAEAFRAATWTPGAKLQFRPRRGTLGMRAYTPIEWDGARGVTRLIAYTHGEGPAADWFRQVAVGDTCEVFGPRRSIDLRGLTGPVVFVGDESSVALACALRTVTPDVRHVFEATDLAELTALLTDLGLAENSVVVPTSEDRALLIEQARDAAVESTEPFDLLLTGDAATIHLVRRNARGWAHKPHSTKAKAYWAKGRTGLD
jgi:NADPH-dependent ferric siderophore reductase